ncbi:MAG: DUF4367 domain-containing protein [Firmicutes bacterium]|nr:DUF4367 domain-containing protein [[Eubacterium] siraeum]MCM1488318.1 DUF4367 domain-containing protein [Bacillota bacterium]
MNDLQAALKNVMERETAGYEHGGEHGFSPKFEKTMNRLIKSENKKKASPKGRYGVFIAAAAAVVALTVNVVASSAGGFSISSNIRDPIYRIPFRQFTFDDLSDSPESIETVYTVGLKDSEFTRVMRNFYDENHGIYTFYSRPIEQMLNDNMYTYENFWFYQHTKNNFEMEFLDARFSVFEELTYKDKTAYYMYYEHFYGLEAMLVWEDEDYCFALSGNFTGEEAVAMADSLKPYEGEITENKFVEELS